MIKNYELRVDNKFFRFDTAKEAYLFYLTNYATKEDFDYYKDLTGVDLKDIADNEKLIGAVFENVFDKKHHVYKMIERADGQHVLASL